MKILVVDDDASGRYMLRVLLEGHGFQVVEADDGLRALEVARDQNPEAVITDLMMPGMDGFSLCRKWVADPVLRDKPLIVYSATYTDPKDRRLAQDAGAAAFLSKPIDPDILVQTVVELIERASNASPSPMLPQEEFLSRHADRLQAKLVAKTGQLAEARRELEEYVARTEAVFDASPDAIISVDAGLRIRSWNAAAAKLFGHAEVETIGSSIELLVPTGDLRTVRGEFSLAGRTGGVVRSEAHWLHKTGTALDVNVSVTQLGPSGGFALTASDISGPRRAAAERKKLEAQLALSMRLESVGRLAGGIAHDFNNILTVILFHAGIIESELEDQPALREDARHVREAAERAAGLTGQLLAFSRRQVLKPEVLDLNQTVRSMARMIHTIIGEDIDLRLGLSSDLARVEADLSQMEQVILNLAVNARDAMPEGGRLVIETRNAEVKQEEAALHGPMEPGRYVALTITDTGVGMDEETRSHAFEPFFTTKEFGKGTGLGLATVYGIVKQSRGFIWLDSAPGAGATVRVYLPRVDRPAVQRDARSQTLAGASKGETILVVEDDEMVRRLARRILERAGYRVLDAASGGDALLMMEQSGEVVDLLLTDVIMPSMHGRELARRLLAARPSVKVVFTSGYTDEVIAQHGVLDPEVSLVWKPFKADTLAAVVRAVLDGERPGGIG